jgi:hypothetical protein
VNRALLAGLADHARAIAGQLARLPLAEGADHETIAAVIVTPAAQLRPPEATVSDLCAGIIRTAQRANQARRDLAARAA